MTGKWSVIGLKSHKQNGGIFYADLQYRIKNLDFMIFAQKNISVEFTYDTTNPNFIDFNQIKEENVVNWAKEIIDYQAIENEVLENYNAEVLKLAEQQLTSEDFPKNFIDLPPEFDTSGI